MQNSKKKIIYIPIYFKQNFYIDNPQVFVFITSKDQIKNCSNDLFCSDFATQRQKIIIFDRTQIYRENVRVNSKNKSKNYRTRKS